MNAAFTVIATRGERLVLSRTTIGQLDSQIGDVHTDMLAIAEVDAESRMTATVLFDPNDIDAAVSELDARFMAGEGALYADIWSLVIKTYAAFNRHELSKTTPDWANIDHRLGVGSATGEMNTYVSAMWEVVPDVSTHIESVHRLSTLGQCSPTPSAAPRRRASPRSGARLRSSPSTEMRSTAASCSTKTIWIWPWPGSTHSADLVCAQIAISCGITIWTHTSDYFISSGSSGRASP